MSTFGIIIQKRHCMASNTYAKLAPELFANGCTPDYEENIIESRKRAIMLSWFFINLR